MSEWQPIETAPKDGTDILTVRTDWGRRIYSVVRWGDNIFSNGFYGSKCWASVGYQGLTSHAVTPIPTHWMPLPAPPK